tara:strand:- start:6385 stop:7329 length:945 start_codon:yes stop_codon:yes gene_type:complete
MSESIESRYQPETSLLKVKGMTFCVEERGNKHDEPILLIMGLACQLTQWPETLLNGLVQNGYRVICFDNRDVGLSEKITSKLKVDTRVSFLKHKLGFIPDANYDLFEMANDTSHILRALNIEDAHIMGVSMGGMIAQIMGSFYPEQVRSLTVMMSSTNSPWLPMPELSLVYKLSKRTQNKHDIDSVTERWYRFWSAVESPAFKADPSHIRSKIRKNYLRSYSPGGTLRQLQAILGTACLKQHLKSISCPTLVIHGEKDPLLKPACGADIVKHIPHSKLITIKGMGHDLPDQLMPRLVSLISEHTQGIHDKTERG